MTNSINCQNQKLPSYSGVTINISNPAMSVPNYNCQCPQCGNVVSNPQVNEQNIQNYPTVQQPAYNQEQNTIQNNTQNTNVQGNSPYTEQSAVNNNYQNGIPNNYSTNPNITQNITQNSLPQAYPAEYYINNYNNQIPTNIETGTNNKNINQDIPKNSENTQTVKNSDAEINEQSKITQEIINNIDERVAAENEIKDNETKKDIVALTDEYIMSLENYLNNPNTDIRVMASKEVLNRLGEDKTRKDDPALNALLNKMLQDPNKIVRIAALSALSSGIASGNDYTMQLLNNIQNDPKADKEDVLEVAQILLKMSQTTETIKVEQDPNKYNRQIEQLNKELSSIKSQQNRLVEVNRKKLEENSNEAVE